MAFYEQLDKQANLIGLTEFNNLPSEKRLEIYKLHLENERNNHLQKINAALEELVVLGNSFLNMHRG